MTSIEIKVMLKDIIDNDVQYECRPNTILLSNPPQFPEWEEYRLGDEIHSDWEYRKVEKWYVYLESDGSYVTSNEHRIGDTIFDKVVFEDSKEACEKWVEENTKKTWLEDAIESQLSHPFAPSCSNSEIKKVCFKNGAEEVCKKILDELGVKLPFYIDTGRNCLLKDIAEIIKDLGVEA